ncbi:MAG TPA: hypothetical protein VGR35_11755 [Tepidisphaeraceae bacterium]|nr:hypothetical protein [Tepidisphaeraceae bacterium]
MSDVHTEWLADGRGRAGTTKEPEHLGRIVLELLRQTLAGMNMERFIMSGAELFGQGELLAEDEEHDGDAEAEAEVSVELPSGFRVDDEATASWAVRKIVEARARAARVREWAARELRRSERDEQWLLRRFGPELEGWLRAELQRRGGRRRCVALPDGTVGIRRQPARLEVVDESRVAAWCARHLPGAVRVCVEAEGTSALELAAWQRSHARDARVKQQVLRDPLARHVTASGELPDGGELRPPEDRLYVK